MKLTRVDAYAFLFGAVFLAIWFGLSAKWKDAAPSTDFFEVNRLYVADFVQDDDPILSYDRTIKQKFFGTWAAEIYDAASKERTIPACFGDGSRIYNPGDEPPVPVTLKWFIDKDCHLEPGQYIVEVVWKIQPEGYPVKEYKTISNIFKVIPRGGALYVDPKIIEQLDLLDNQIPEVPK